MIDFPRVSEIISPLNNFDGIPEHILNAAAARGTLVHEYCENHANGLMLIDIPEHIQGYVDSFRRFFDDNVDTVLLSEKRLYSENLYCGQIDLLVYIDDIPTLLDIKTPVAKSKTWPIQQAAYMNLLRENGYEVERRCTLRIKKDGSKAIINYYEDEEDFKVFDSCLRIYKYKNNIK